MKLTKLLGLAAAALISTSASANMLVLDDFNYQGPFGLFVDGSSADLSGPDLDGDFTGSDTGVAGFSDVFATTTMTLVAEGDLEYDDSTSRVLVNGAQVLALGNDQLVYSNDTGVWSTLSIKYTTNQNTGDPISIFAAYEAFFFEVISADIGLGFEIILEDTSGFASYDNPNVAPVSEFGPSETRYVSFDLFPTINFSEIVSVEMIITAASGADLALGSVGLIPEPAAIAIFGLGLLGLGLARRRKA